MARTKCFRTLYSCSKSKRGTERLNKIEYWRFDLTGDYDFEEIAQFVAASKKEGEDGNIAVYVNGELQFKNF